MVLLVILKIAPVPAHHLNAGITKHKIPWTVDVTSAQMLPVGMEALQVNLIVHVQLVLPQISVGPA